jgi:hypothetical protein
VKQLQKVNPACGVGVQQKSQTHGLKLLVVVCLICRVSTEAFQILIRVTHRFKQLVM